MRIFNCSVCHKWKPYCANDMCKICYNRQYRKTDRGKESNRKSSKRFRASEYGKKAIKKYRESDRGKKVNEKANECYRNSEKGKETKKRFRESEHYKQYQKQYYKSECYQQYLKQYRKTEKCKETQKKGRKRFRESEKGKESRRKSESKRRRGLEYVELFHNIFNDVKADRHHISEGFVVAIPSSLHEAYSCGQNSELHKKLLKPVIENLYGFWYIIEEKNVPSMDDQGIGL